MEILVAAVSARKWLSSKPYAREILKNCGGELQISTFFCGFVIKDKKCW